MVKANTLTSISEARERNLKLALGQIEKEFGKGSIMRLGDRPQQAVDVISSGAIALDIALGCNGFPRGRVAASSKSMVRNHPARRLSASTSSQMPRRQAVVAPSSTRSTHLIRNTPNSSASIRTI